MDKISMKEAREAHKYWKNVRENTYVILDDAGRRCSISKDRYENDKDVEPLTEQEMLDISTLEGVKKFTREETAGLMRRIKKLGYAPLVTRDFFDVIKEKGYNWKDNDNMARSDDVLKHYDYSTLYLDCFVRLLELKKI